jgi:CheY-like chemotaxis protein
MSTILIVEDDIDIREALSEVLNDEGYQVAVAGHGREALDMIGAGLRPSLILLDLMMPVMNGWQFAEEFQSRYGDLHTPIIALSADANIEAKALGLGAKSFLKKPVLIEDLLKAIVALYPKEKG